MCRVLSISESAYHKWKKKELDQACEQVNESIIKIYKANKKRYGSPRITEELNDQGIKISKSTVARRMKNLSIKALRKRRFVPTTDSNHDYPIAPNILNRAFDVDQLNKIWVSDITYIRVANRWCYLTIIMDLADRMIIAWTLSNNLTAECTSIATYKKAINQRGTHENLIFHSDRGVQYACTHFRNLMVKHNNIQSMSRKGNCWDNAVAESFFKTIKYECVQNRVFIDFAIAQLELFRYIDGWYNTVRKHSKIGYLSPINMHKLLLTKLVG